MPPATLSPTWTLLCWNMSVDSHQYGNSRPPVALWPPAGPGSYPSPVNGTGDEGDGDAELDSRDRHALLYIVVVLLFYSTGIVIAIVMYLKREKAEIEEEKAYDDYASFRSDPDRWARYFRVQRMIAQLDRVEREAEEKRRREKETAEQQKHSPAVRSASVGRSPRKTSAPSALKIVFGSAQRSSGAAGVDPTPLLATPRAPARSLTTSRSAGSRLDVCCGGVLGDSPMYLAPAASAGDVHAGSTRAASPAPAQSTDKLKSSLSPKSSTTLQVQVSNV